MEELIDVFEYHFNNGYVLISLITISNYICKRVINNNFKDENGLSIDNKYGYFKNSMLSNINLLAGRKENDELWSDEHIEELINMR